MIDMHADGPVGLITLARPDKRNALTPEMFTQLREAVSRTHANGARVLLLAGNGKVFCGGFDLKLCLEHKGTLGDLLNGLFESIELLRSLPIPIVIAAHGAAIAGGCALLGGADIVVTDRRAQLGYPVLSLGVSPAVSAPYLRLAIGDGPCRARLLEPTLISGDQAVRLGLAHEVVDTPEEVRSRALVLARELAAKPPGALAATRQWMMEIEAVSRGSNPRAGLEASLALVGGEEEQRRLSERFLPR